MAFKIFGLYDRTMTTHASRIVWVAGLGLFLATLDTGIINVALPSIQTAWHTTAAIMAWAVSAYTVTLAGTVLLWGRLADRMGPQRIFWWGLIGFAVTSGACGAAPTLSALMAARILQGLASAMIQGTAIAFATVGLPSSQRHLATGTLAMLQGLGPVIGPALGGVLLTWTSWRTLFWMNLPLTIPLIVLLTQSHPASVQPKHGQPLGVLGNGFVLVTVSLGLMALTTTGTIRMLCLIGAGAALAGIVGYERTSATPLVPRPLGTSRAFWASAGAIVMVGGATALGFMVPPYMLHLWGHWPPWQVGLMNMSAPLMLVVFSRPASRLLSRRPATPLMLGGLGLMVIAFAVLAATATARSPVLMFLSLASYGIGAAVFFPANLTALLDLAGPEVYGTMGAVQRMAINLGTAIDAAVVGVFLVHGATAGRVASLLGIRISWVFGAMTLLLAMGGLHLSYASAKGQRRDRSA